jgi:hypothetical protein
VPKRFIEPQILINSFDGATLWHPVTVGAAARIISLAAFRNVLLNRVQGRPEILCAVSVSENARDIDTARKEVQALTEAVRSAGDGLNALTARCKVLDDAIAVFHGVARSRLWWLIALAFLSGAAVGWATFFIKL